MSLRTLLSALSAALLSACGVKQMLPEGPALKGEELGFYAPFSPSGVRYTGPARVDYPVLPFSVFGVFYDIDLVVQTRQPDWDMHEYARIHTPEGPVWMAKDAGFDGVQSIIADRDDLGAMVAEIPVPRHKGAVEVTDRSSGRDIDVSLAYTNIKGEPVTLDYKATMPAKAPAKRNGSTMGHSRQAAVPVLDLQRIGPAGKVHMTIAGERVKTRTLFGFFPLKFIIEQAQGGFAVTNFVQAPSDGGFTLTRPGAEARDPATGEAGWPVATTEHWSYTENGATTDTGLNAFRYTLVEGGVGKVVVGQFERAVDPLTLWFQPALPDLRRPFEGVATSRFRVDINGQTGHATGELRVWWEDANTLRTELRPSAPWWVAERPMDGRITYGADGTAQVTMDRVPAVEG